MTRNTRHLTALFIVLLVTFGGSRTWAQEGQTKAIVRIADEIDFDAVGNATGESEIVLPQELYAKVKTLMSSRELVQENGQQVTKLRAPRIENVLKYLGITSTAYEVSDVKGEFDDEASTIHVTYRIQGRCSFRHNQWEFPVVRDPELKMEVRKVDIKGETVKMELRAKQQAVQGITRLTLRLPQGATKVDFRKKTLDVVYNAPAPVPSQTATATRPEMRLDAKPQLMSALYKLYGNPKWIEMWTARSVFQNDTAETFSDYRVRFRIEGYSSWSPWQRSDKVFPGQTVVDSFYPVIDSKIAQLKGSTPAQVEIEYEYTRPNGDRVSETEAGRIKLLGMNEALWSSIEVDDNASWYEVFRNSPLVLSSFTSATDPVMMDVVGMVSKATGGAGATISDEQALLFMGTLYNLLRQNIAYETTPGSWQQGLLHQHLKYGRDVLRSRSGTCVNLSILYASVCEAAGLKAYIVMGPGHAFAAAKLPQSGIPVAVETTGCGGGTKESSMTFSQARESAYRTYQKWYNDGLIIEVDIASSREQGVPSPELPDAGMNPLKEWGIQQPDKIDQVILPKLLAHVKTGLETYKLPYSPLAGRTAVQVNFNTQQGNQWNTVMQTFEESELLTTVSFVPNQVPESQRNAVALILSGLNENLWQGNFELTKAGSIAYRTGTDVKGGNLVPTMVQNEIQYHFDTMQKMLPEFRKLATVDPSAEKKEDQTQSAATAEPAPVHPLVGRWSAYLNDSEGRRYGKGVRINADSTYGVLVTTGGLSAEERGRWSYEGNVLTTTADQGLTRKGTIRWINKNRIVFTDESSEVTYDRVVP